MTKQAEEALTLLMEIGRAVLKDGVFLFTDGTKAHKESVEECIMHDYVDIFFTSLGAMVKPTKEGRHYYEEMKNNPYRDVDLSQEGLEEKTEGMSWKGSPLPPTGGFVLIHDELWEKTVDVARAVKLDPIEASTILSTVCMNDGGELIKTTSTQDGVQTFLCSKCGVTTFIREDPFKE